MGKAVQQLKTGLFQHTLGDRMSLYLLKSGPRTILPREYFKGLDSKDLMKGWRPEPGIGWLTQQNLVLGNLVGYVRDWLSLGGVIPL